MYIMYDPVMMTAPILGASVITHQYRVAITTNGLRQPEAVFYQVGQGTCWTTAMDT